MHVGKRLKYYEWVDKGLRVVCGWVSTLEHCAIFFKWYGFWLCCKG